MSYLGSWKTGSTIWLPLCNTHNANTGMAQNADSTGTPAYRVYYNNSTNVITSGSGSIFDSTSSTGFYMFSLDLNSSVYTKGGCYTVYAEAIIGGVKGTLSHSFQLEAEVDANSVSDSTAIKEFCSTALYDNSTLLSILNNSITINTNTTTINTNVLAVGTSFVNLVSTAIYNNSTLLNILTGINGLTTNVNTVNTNINGLTTNLNTVLTNTTTINNNVVIINTNTTTINNNILSISTAITNLNDLASTDIFGYTLTDITSTQLANGQSITAGIALRAGFDRFYRKGTQSTSQQIIYNDSTVAIATMITTETTTIQTREATL